MEELRRRRNSLPFIILSAGGALCILLICPVLSTTGWKKRTQATLALRPGLTVIRQVCEGEADELL